MEKTVEEVLGLAPWEIEEAYKEMLDECHPAVMIGYGEYLASDILKNCDPIAYDIGLGEFTDILLEEKKYENERN